MKSLKSLDEIRNSLSEMDKRTFQAEKDLAVLKEFTKQFEALQNNLSILQNYYHSGEWLKDTEKLSAQSKNEHFYSASQDAIWNVSQEIYTEKIKILQLLVNSLNS